jgi:hypothetical protein
MISGENIDKCDSYLNDALPPEERQQFDEELARNEELRDDFLIYKESIEIIQLSGLRRDLNNIILTSSTPVQRHHLYSNPIVWTSIAAGILLVIFIFFDREGKKSPEKLFSLYYKPYPDVVTLRSGKPDFILALSAYSEGEFLQANESFIKLGVTNDTLLFYRAQCNLALDKPDSTILLLNKISPSSIFEQQVTWYLALAHIKKGEAKAAISYLRKIKKKEFGYRDAQALLLKLTE